MRRRKKKVRISHVIRRTSIIAVALAIIIFLIKYAPNYVKEANQLGVKLIINNNNVTKTIKKEIIFKDNQPFLSTDDIKNYFDEYLTEQDGCIITTSRTKTVKIANNSDKMYVNGSYIDMKENTIKENSVNYISLEDMALIYNFEYKYNDKNNTIIIDSLNKKLVQATSKRKQSVKYKATSLSKNIEKLARGETVIIIQDNEKNEDVNIDGWLRIRTKSGNIGYVKAKSLINRNVVRENLTQQHNDEKVSIMWDYYNQYTIAPTRTEAVAGINVVSPSFYELKSDGSIVTNMGESGKNYIKWAHDNNYKVWPTFSNSALNNLKAVSTMMSTFETRSKLIDNIINAVIENEVDGIVVDFENMYKEDKDKYSSFIIELAPRLREIGMKLAVEVTEPDGSDTWSLCYDRNTIGNVADYIIFIGYDQHNASSTNAGSVASYDWVELNITKFLGQEGVSANKVVLAMPFYTRLWKEENGKLTSKVVNMKNVNIPNGVTKTWNDNSKQNYIEYENGGAKYKMWIEDEQSISAKLDLVNKYKLGGAGFWEKDRENEAVWDIVKEKLNN